MPSIKLTDRFGLDIDAQLAPTSSLLKYFQQLPSLRFDALDFSKLGGLTLDQPAVQSLSAGGSFQSPVNLGDGAGKLSVAGGAHSSVQIVNDTKQLPGSGDASESQPDVCYVAFSVEATAAPSGSAGVGAWRLGASASAKLTLASYSRFPLKSGVTLLDALRQTVAGFAIPACSADLADLPAGQIVAAAGSGSLGLSCGADLLTVANPLASVSLPAPLPAASVSAGGSATVDVTLELDAEYQVVARKLDTGVVRLGWFLKDAAKVNVSAKVSEGLSAGLGGADLFSRVVGAISSGAQADLMELSAAGVPDDQAAAIQGAVRAAVNRKLEIAVASELSASDSHSATFLYDITAAELTEGSRQAVDQALRGDLTGLHATGLPGVSCVRSLWDDVRKRGVELDVNLLGILNFRSIASLSLEGKVLYEPATGSLAITDQATAERIRSTQVNFGADTRKLRQALAESFLITAAYHGAMRPAGAEAPSLRCSHCFFDLQNATSRSDMAGNLRIGVALGLLSGGGAELPGDVTDFGRTLVAASTDYDEGLVNKLFLDANDAPLPHEAYETAGRTALQFVVGEGDDDAVRRQPAIDDALWRRMKDAGQPNFPGLFPGVPAPFIGAITADYSTIQWWAGAMQVAAQKLAAIRLWLARNPAASLEEPGFQKLRQALATHLQQVAANTREEFGRPWGLIAMSLLVTNRAAARILITSPALMRNERRALALATGA